LVDGKITVIEYSDLPDELAEKRNPDGSLAFRLGSIALHIINRSFVERINAEGISLPLHRAVKKIPHIDRQGKHIDLETIREQEFAPTKNATGIDSVETARQMMVARAANWLESAGVTVPKKPDGSIDCLIEIAPSFALKKEDLKSKLSRVPQIKPKDKLYLA